MNLVVQKWTCLTAVRSQIEYLIFQSSLILSGKTTDRDDQRDVDRDDRREPDCEDR